MLANINIGLVDDAGQTIGGIGARQGTRGSATSDSPPADSAAPGPIVPGGGPIVGDLGPIFDQLDPDTGPFRPLPIGLD